MPALFREYRRVVGTVAGDRPGPTLVAVGGLHGNEPAGVFAAERVLARLERGDLPLRGEFTALAGNLEALAQGRRFVEEDLNRVWTPAGLAAAAGGGGGEAREQRELLAALAETVARARGPLTLVDLHTASAATPPFTLASDTLRNRRIVFALPNAVILGLEEAIEGTLLEHMTEAGHTGLVVEAGRHDDPQAVDIHEHVLWLTLAACGLLDEADVPDGARRRAVLREMRGPLPRVMEVRHRHRVRPEDGFSMEPGFAGFQHVAAGTLLGRDRSGEVRAPHAGRLLLPLYQKQGSEGFFLVHRVRRAWLWLSALLRRAGLSGLVRWLPGVRRASDDAATVEVDPAVAKWLVVEVFHLFGYRKRRTRGGKLLFTRRPD